MEKSLCAELLAAGATFDDIDFRRSADMRYVGQGFEVNAELPNEFGRDVRNDVAESFARSYAAKFGRELNDFPIEVVNWRVEAFSTALRGARERLKQSAAGEADGPRARPVFYPDVGDYVTTTVVSEAGIQSGRDYEGPVLIEQAGSTIVVGPGDVCNKDADGSISIRLAGGRR